MDDAPPPKYVPRPLYYTDCCYHGYFRSIGGCVECGMKPAEKPDYIPPPPAEPKRVPKKR